MPVRRLHRAELDGVSSRSRHRDLAAETLLDGLRGDLGDAIGFAGGSYRAIEARAFSLGPGDQCEVLVAIWLPRADGVRISRSLAFRLTGKEPRFLSHSLGYGLVDTTPILPDGRQFIRLEITQQGRVIGERAFKITIDHQNGFAEPTIVYDRPARNRGSSAAAW